MYLKNNLAKKTKAQMAIMEITGRIERNARVVRAHARRCSNARNEETSTGRCSVGGSESVPIICTRLREEGSARKCEHVVLRTGRGETNGAQIEGADNVIGKVRSESSDACADPAPSRSEFSHTRADHATSCERDRINAKKRVAACRSMWGTGRDYQLSSFARCCAQEARDARGKEGIEKPKGQNRPAETRD